MVILPRVPFWNHEIPETSLPILFCFRMYFIYLLDINTSDRNLGNPILPSEVWKEKSTLFLTLGINSIWLQWVHLRMIWISLPSLRVIMDFQIRHLSLFHVYRFFFSLFYWFELSKSVWIPRVNANVFGPIICCTLTKIHHVYKSVYVSSCESQAWWLFSHVLLF